MSKEKKYESKEERKCTLCGEKLTSSLTSFSIASATYCETCFKRLMAKPLKCPCCKRKIDKESEQISLLLPLNNNKRDTLKISIAICPFCYIMFIDPIQFAILQNIKKLQNSKN